MCVWTRQSRSSEQYQTILNSTVSRDALPSQKELPEVDGSLDVSLVAQMRDDCDFKRGFCQCLQ